MEYEVRYYFPLENLDELFSRLDSTEGISRGPRVFERTMQFDHPCESMSFYTKEIDGRFRIRVSSCEEFSSCKISWKRRLPSTIDSLVNEEEEVEVSIKYSEYDNLIFLINNVLKMKDISSYERYRTCFINDEVEISVDEYPFGIALGIEGKTESDSSLVVKKWTGILGLDINKAYRLSWDDKYGELCRKQGIKQYSHVTFDLPMPKVD